jgi:peptide subunit release factor 1 (eRF1)
MITLHIPKDSSSFNLNEEISSAKNIRDKNTRRSTLEGLNKIQQYL